MSDESAGNAVNDIITEDMDIESNWNDLTMSQKKQVFKIIKPMLYN